MRHLLITLDFLPQTGGVSRYYARVTQEARMLGEDVFVLAPGVVSEEFVVRKRLIHPVWRWFPVLWQVWKRRNAFDWFWVGQVLPVGTAVWFISFIKPIKYVVFCHGMDVAQLKGRKKWLAKKVLSRANKIVCNSLYTQRLVQALGISPQKIQLLYPCPAISGEISSEEKDPILLTVCRLVSRKGVDLVIRALPKIRESFPHVRYVVVGEGPMRAVWEKLAQTEGVSDLIIWKGAVSDAQLGMVYKQAQIFVMTPREEKGDVEGFGMVYLEANSFGLPVVGTKTGGVTEAIEEGKTGLFVTENPDDIAQTLVTVLRDKPLQKRLGTQGRIRVQTQFQWNKQVQSFIQTL